MAVETGNINDAYRTFIFSSDFDELTEEWQQRIIADLAATHQSPPARICCFKREDGSSWYGGCELQGGDCIYIGEGCPGQ
ncbi:MAG TPA: hypothetical protein VD966_14750 [Pyrinomonadaceae bacterium]|nr:hypothetical protein [Pyrinomonadaceae bacterium]